MKTFVKVKPNSKIRKISKIDDSHFEVRVKEPSREGKANRAVLEAMAEYFKISKSRLEIISGFKSKNKIISLQK